MKKSSKGNSATIDFEEKLWATADNEHPDGKRSLEMFKGALGCTIIELDGRGHYTGEDMKTEEFPELFEVVLK